MTTNTSKNNVCPYCGEPYLRRIPRTSWMKVFGVERHYECDVCHRRCYVLWGKLRHS